MEVQMYRCPSCLQWVSPDAHRCPVEEPDAFAEYINSAIDRGDTTEEELSDRFDVPLSFVRGWRDGTGVPPIRVARSDIVLFIDPVVV
jgi:hypothetical protein